MGCGAVQIFNPKGKLVLGLVVDQSGCGAVHEGRNQANVAVVFAARIRCTVHALTLARTTGIFNNLCAPNHVVAFSMASRKGSQPV